MIERPAPGTRTRIGPYRILGLLGTGGMGEVYLARPSGMPAGALVALKTVRLELDLDDGFRVRFRREIAAAAAVRSPRTAAFLGGDASSRTPWLATEYVPGPSLAEAVTRAGPLPEPVVRAMGAGLALALADMHAVRVLHRDLKPGNVLLGPDGPKVIDFGIAQAFDATQLTRTGVVVGSPGYISPEHVNGSAALVPASDVFCLGAVLAFAAAGRGPFDDSDMAAVIFRIARGDAELSGVPPLLREVISRCLDARPERRPGSRELAALLLPEGPSVPFPWTPGVREQQADYERAARECADSAPAEPGPAPNAPPLPPGPPPVAFPLPEEAGTGGPRRAPQLVLAAVAVTVCLLLGYLLWPDPPAGGGGPGSGARSSGPGAGPSHAADTVGVRAVPRADGGRTGDFGRAATDQSVRPAGWKAWKSTVPGGTGDCSFAESALLCGGTKGLTALDAADGKRRWRVPKNAAEAVVAGFTKGTVYAFVGQALIGYRITDGAERWRTELPAGHTGSAAVQDGDTLFYVTAGSSPGTGRLAARRLTGDRGELWHKPYDGTRPVLVADDGRLVVVAGDTRIVDAATGTVKERLSANDFPCRDPVLRGRVLVCRASTGTGLAAMNDVNRPGEHRIIAGGIEVRGPVALTDDGTVVVSDDESLRAFSVAGDAPKWPTDRFADGGGAPSVAGDLVLAATGAGVGTYRRTDGEPENTTSYTGVPFPPKDPPQLLAIGDVVFLGFRDGTVVSGYVP